MQSTDMELITRAIDITNNVAIQLPQELNLTFGASELPPLWAIPVEKMPYGLATVSGQVLVCSHSFCFKYKAWRVADTKKLQYGAWQRVPETISRLLPRLKIRSSYTGHSSTYCTWSATHEDAWQKKGVLSHYNLKYGSFKKTSEEDMSFSRFMEINYWDLVYLLDPVDSKI